MKNKETRELATHAAQRLEMIYADSGDEVKTAFELRRIYLLLLQGIIPVGEVYLSTHFSRLSYLAAQNQWHWKDKYLLHKFRRVAENAEALDDQEQCALGLYACAFILKAGYGQDLTFFSDLSREQMALKFIEPRERKSYKKVCRLQMLERVEESLRYIVIDEAEPQVELILDLGQTAYNDRYVDIIQYLDSELLPFPILLAAHDVDVTEEDVYLPRMIVLEPDYLFNVTAVASCFSGRHIQMEGFLINRFMPIPRSEALLLGNIANFFLDRLIHNPEQDYRSLFLETFQMYALQYACLSDEELTKMYQRAEAHFRTVRLFVTQGMQSLGLRIKDSQVEPSFYSEIYGIQGRLDLFVEDKRRKKSPVIVELKSGKPFMPNVHRVGNSHYIQTLLYDLLVRSITEDRLRPRNFILYSGARETPLRSAPLVKAQQEEALMVRNKMYVLEKKLQISEDRSDLLKWTSEGIAAQLIGFLGKNVRHFHNVLTALNELEYTYFREMTRFISREMQYKKTGAQEIEARRGDASLWNDSPEEKEERFEMYSYLQILSEYVRGDDHFIELALSSKSNVLANFRVGDMVVLYPVTGQKDAAVRNQIFKGHIVELTQGQIKVRLRNPQLSKEHFKLYDFWNMEPDTLDSGIRRMYQGLYEFAQLDSARRSLLLGQRAPRWSSPAEFSWSEDLTEHQKAVLTRLTALEDYALIWGPPGTGKTSRILKEYVRYLYEATQDSILLVAYTNRAVDEICSALSDLGLESLRIGSRYGTSERHRDMLLQNKVKEMKKRSELHRFIGRQRIVVGTLASLLGKPELFTLMKFDILILDEASQILEPSLIGFLGRFKRFVLIGDHKQLPAVVLQRPEEATVKSEQLLSQGFRSYADSLFERFLFQSEEKGYDSILSLHEQGRMHRAIMDFPNSAFYGGLLKTILPEQEEPLPEQDHNASEMLSQRFAFRHCEPRPEERLTKRNTAEAKQIVSIVNDLLTTYGYEAQDIGVICPYRAQVALVKQMLETVVMDSAALLVDTVERFQGGARKVILISLTVHRASQLNQIVSLSTDGMADRKLNVALTRARERLYVLGNREVLSLDSGFREMLDYLSQNETNKGS